MRIITLTTDFGDEDGYVGTMKGVILSIAPDVRLVDLSHHIPPQDIRRAAFVVAEAAPYFPPGTIHLAVVDPGVGSGRRALIVETEGALFVGPDNGRFSFILDARRRPSIGRSWNGSWRCSPVELRPPHHRRITASGCSANGMPGATLKKISFL